MHLPRPDEDGVALRGGHHCNQPLMRKLGVSRADLLESLERHAGVSSAVLVPADRAALDAHFKVPASRAFAAQAGQLAARRPDLAIYEASEISLR